MSVNSTPSEPLTRLCREGVKIISGNQIALLASSASIELVSSSASAKFHKTAVRRYIERPGPIDRTPETPGSGKKPVEGVGETSNLVHRQIFLC